MSRRQKKDPNAPKVHTHNVPELTDPGAMSLGEWATHIASLMQLYGPSALLTLDAGYNNICASISYTEPVGIFNTPKE